MTKLVYPSCATFLGELHNSRLVKSGAHKCHKAQLVKSGAHKCHKAQRNVKLLCITGLKCCRTPLCAFYLLRIVTNDIIGAVTRFLEKIILILLPVMAADVRSIESPHDSVSTRYSLSVVTYFVLIWK